MNIIEAVIIAAAALTQQDGPPVLRFAMVKDNPAILASTTPSALVIFDQGEETLRIETNGAVAFGKGVTPNEAAKSFAKALKELGWLRSPCAEALPAAK